MCRMTGFTTCSASRRGSASRSTTRSFPNQWALRSILKGAPRGNSTHSGRWILYSASTTFGTDPAENRGLIQGRAGVGHAQGCEVGHVQDCSGAGPAAGNSWEGCGVYPPGGQEPVVPGANEDDDDSDNDSDFGFQDGMDPPDGPKPEYEV
ncbi:hypothetical protein BU23DRAFT_574980 [Bimuria novae-zelandiae CBS 107.79]|uniref:Uncharacterized protein n=1 Tax=Bimuria novae-zelandiae CBS 107.79 TaxID=1447943 RepID=A0A6A5UN69_9PLEO|nr:hypothetical protein BU23DRAFT_574980 [Bimuria novae-zelandiae CBS 107.79]